MAVVCARLFWGDRALDRCAGAERRAANPGRRCAGRRRGLAKLFSVWDLRSAVAELFFGTPPLRNYAGAFSSARPRTAGFPVFAERDRLEAAPGKGGRVFLFAHPFPRAREAGRASASGFDPAAPARSYGDCSARADPETAGRGVAAAWCALLAISGWVIGLLIGWRAGAERRAARFWSPMLAGTARPAARFLFGTWRSAVAELFGNRRSQPAGRRAAFGMYAHSVGFWHRPRARPLLESLLGKGGRVFPFSPRFLVRARAAPRPAVSIRRRRARKLWGDCSARATIETAGRGVAAACVRSGISRLGDRALDRLACGRRTAHCGQRRETRRLLS